jgi:tripartite-type tricarboxylate transporter receptor subunit TctC
MEVPLTITEELRRAKSFNRISRRGSKDMRRATGIVLAYAAMAGLGMGCAALSYGQAYPVKPIRLIIPFAPGGTTDTPWRIVAPKLGEELGAQVVIENRPGAGASIGAALAAAAPPDGYTLLGTSNSHALTAALYKNLPYDAIADFVAVAQIASTCQVLVVHPSLPARSVGQLIALAKANPGKIDYSSPGTGNTPHLFFELFKSMTRIDMHHVPYKSIATQVPDLVAGRVPAAFIGVTILLPYAEANRLRPLAVSCTKRSQFLPDVPTMHEAGVKGYEGLQLAGMLAPKGLSPEIAQRLEASLRKITAMPEVQKMVIRSGNELSFDSGSNFGAMQKSELAKWGKLIRDLGIQLN